MRNHNIPISETAKFLGLIFDAHLNFKAHITYIKSRCQRALNLIKKLSHTNWGADRHSLTILYKATVLSIIDYGSEIYGSASEAALKILDPIHNGGLRICTGAFRSSPVSSVQVECGELPLSIHREFIKMKSALRIRASDSPTKNLFDLRDIFINNHSPPFPVRANRLIESLNINIEIPSTVKLPAHWNMNEVKICTHLKYLLKSHSYTTEHYRQKTIEHIQR